MLFDLLVFKCNFLGKGDRGRERINVLEIVYDFEFVFESVLFILMLFIKWVKIKDIENCCIRTRVF